MCGEAVGHHCCKLKMMYVAVCYCSVLLGIAAAVHGSDMSRNEKQIFLDLHNYYRASVSAANMRRMVRLYRRLDQSATLQDSKLLLAIAIESSYRPTV